jgi:hypothetical protein
MPSGYERTLEDSSTLSHGSAPQELTIPGHIDNGSSLPFVSTSVYTSVDLSSTQYRKMMLMTTNDDDGMAARHRLVRILIHNPTTHAECIRPELKIAIICYIIIHHKHLGNY